MLTGHLNERTQYDPDNENWCSLLVKNTNSGMKEIVVKMV